MASCGPPLPHTRTQSHARLTRPKHTHAHTHAPPAPARPLGRLPPPFARLQVINEGWTKWLGVHLKDLKAEERQKKISAMSIIHANQWNAEEM